MFLKQFWETESISTESNELEKPNEEFLSDTRFTGELYEIGLHWKSESLAIDNDYELCPNRLKLLHHKLQKQPETWQNTTRESKSNWRRV